MTDPQPQYPVDPTGNPPPSDPTAAPGAWSPQYPTYPATPAQPTNPAYPAQPYTPPIAETPPTAPYGQPTYGQPTYGTTPDPAAPQYGTPYTPQTDPAAPQYGAPYTPQADPAAPQYGTPAYTAADPAAPQYGTPAYGAPAYGAPAYGQPPPYGAGTNPYLPQQPKRNGGKIALIIILVVVVLIALCIGGSVLLVHSSNSNSKSSGGTTTPTTGVTTGSTAGTSTAPLTPGEALFAKVVKPPSGSDSYTFDNSTTGIFTAAQISQETFQDPDQETGRLNKAGFVAGAGRDYVRPDGVEILVFLLEFKDKDGAKSTYNNVVSGRADDDTVTGTFAVPGGKGYEWDTIDDLGNRRSEMYKTVGDVLILLNVYTPGHISTSDNLQFLSDQVTALG